MLSRVWIPALKYRAHEIEGGKTNNTNKLKFKKTCFVCLGVAMASIQRTTRVKNKWFHLTIVM